MINWKKVKQHVVHHGLGRTLVHYAFIVIPRFAPCEISWVFAADGTPTGAGHVEGFCERRWVAPQSLDAVWDRSRIEGVGRIFSACRQTLTAV